MHADPWRLDRFTTAQLAAELARRGAAQDSRQSRGSLDVGSTTPVGSTT
jgi:hypothetical protein